MCVLVGLFEFNAVGFRLEGCSIMLDVGCDEIWFNEGVIYGTSVGEGLAFVVFMTSVGKVEGRDEGVAEATFVVGLGVAFSVGDVENETIYSLVESTLGTSVGLVEKKSETAYEGLDVGLIVGNTDGVVSTENEGFVGAKDGSADVPLICDCFPSIGPSTVSGENCSVDEVSDGNDPCSSVMRNVLLPYP